MSNKGIHKLNDTIKYEDSEIYKINRYDKRYRSWSNVTNLITEETGKHSNYCNKFIIINVLLIIIIGSYSILNKLI